jgi:hypothetical protein
MSIFNGLDPITIAAIRRKLESSPMQPIDNSIKEIDYTRPIDDKIPPSTVKNGIQGFGIGSLGGLLGGVLSVAQLYALQGISNANDIRQNTESYKTMLSNTAQPSIYGNHGMINGEESLVAQLEKGEKMVFPDMSIVDVLSKKDHKDMEKDEKTDVIPMGAYIASTDERWSMKKKDAEDIVLGATPIHYSEGGNKGEYRELKLSDMFTKDKMTPAELVESVRKNIPVVKEGEDEYDPIKSITNEENRNTRTKYLAEIVRHNLRKNPKIAQPNVNKENVISANDGILAGTNLLLRQRLGVGWQPVYADNMTGSIKTHKNGYNNFGSLRNSDGSFRSYNNIEEGLSALYSDLDAKLNGRSDVMRNAMGAGYQNTATLNDMLRVYHPVSDNGEETTSKYVNSVAKDAGVSKDTRLKDVDVISLMKAIAKHETAGYKKLKDLKIF